MLLLTDNIMIDAPELPEDFGLYGEDGTFEGENYDAFSDLVESLWGIKYFDYKHGVSKVLITSIPGDYVYKFPFNGYFTMNDDYYNRKEEDDDYCEQEVEKDEFIYFEGAYGEDPSNYCNAEIELLKQYNENYDYKFNRMFPYTRKIQIKNITCYKQERCSCIYETNIGSVHAPSKQVTAHSKAAGFIASWLGEIEYRYGTQYALDFLQFADDYLDDMHRGNYGYSEIDNRPVIIDWGGYNR